jgi:hypothetical protein
MPNGDIGPKVLRYVQIASAFGKKAVDQLAPLQADAEKAAESRSAIVTELVDTGNIQDHQKEAADGMLQSHAGTMQLLKSVLARIEKLKVNQKNASDLGEGVDPSVIDAAPEFDSLNSPFVGQRTSERKASDNAMLAVLDDPR